MSDLVGKPDYRFSHNEAHVFQRGNILRYNWIHHVLRYVPGSDNKGISLENQVSSTSMKYNVLSDVNIVFILFVFIVLSMK